jgi:hypothetical protein
MNAAITIVPVRSALFAAVAPQDVLCASGTNRKGGLGHEQP